MRWDETTVGVAFFEESTEPIILCNAKAMGPMSLCGIYPIPLKIPLKNGNM